MEGHVKKQIIQKPVISEKSVNYYRMYKICTFRVNNDATKKDISFSFKELFGIEPKSIRTVVSRENKKFRSGSRKAPKFGINRKYVKKAYIGIGDNILDIFESIK